MSARLIIPEAEQQVLLDKALQAVNVATIHMKRNLMPPAKLMDALKDCSTFLAELTTGNLDPELYDELYRAVGDSLQKMRAHLDAEYSQGKNSEDKDKLADVYELVQYAGNVVPRLYLMVTVGSVYMATKGAPVKEIMNDLLQMSQGIQHPIRSMFLRHHLILQTRNSFPLGDGDGLEGNLQDSIDFTFSNFVETNKLWVRFQNQGHSLDRQHRERQRKALEMLVGVNISALSQIVDLEHYRVVLVSLLQQVVHCKDGLAQEYLMLAIIHGFPPEFHLETLKDLLEPLGHLQPNVNVREIITQLIERLTDHARNNADQLSTTETLHAEESSITALLSRAQISDTEIEPPVEVDDPFPWEDDKKDEKQDTLTDPDDGSVHEGLEGGKDIQAEQDGPSQEVDKKAETKAPIAHLFDTFYRLIAKYESFSITDLMAVFVSLTELALVILPGQVEYVDKVLAFALQKIKRIPNSPELITAQAPIQKLIMAPFEHYQSIFTPLALPHLHLFIKAQPPSTRMTVVTNIAQRMISERIKITTPSQLQHSLEVYRILIEEQTTSTNHPLQNHAKADKLAHSQGLLARIVHLIGAPTNDIQLELLTTLQIALQAGGRCVRYTSPALITALFRLARSYKSQKAPVKQLRDICRMLESIILEVGSQDEQNAKLVFRLWDSAAQIADQLELPGVAKDFFVNALNVYDKDISNTLDLDEFNALCLIIGSLHSTRNLPKDDYDALSRKVTKHCNRLLNKRLQASSVMLASHLWWPTETRIYGETIEALELTPGDMIMERQNGKSVLECLQQSLRMTDDILDKNISLKLFVEILDRYVYYNEQGNEHVHPKFIAALVKLIRTQIKDMGLEGKGTNSTTEHVYRTFAYLEEHGTLPSV